MRSVHCAFWLTATLLIGVSRGFSQEAIKPTAEEDLRAMRQMMEEQALKIEAISQQVTKLTQLLSAHEAQVPVPQPVTPQTTPTPASVELPAPAETGPIHLVAKGETLTSIARHNKITVAELLKLNKIENDRALQIGQPLILPTPKAQETALTPQPK